MHQTFDRRGKIRAASGERLVFVAAFIFAHLG